MTKKLNTVLLSACTFLILLTLFFLSVILGFSKIIDYFINLYGYILICWICYSWISVTNEKLFTPYIIFILFFIVFNYGQPLLWALGMQQSTDLSSLLLFKGSNIQISNYDLQMTKCYICFIVYFLHLGSLCYQISKHQKKKKQKSSQKSYHKYMLIIGVIIGTVAIPMTLYRYSYFYALVRRLGYGAIYYNNDFQYASLTFIIEMFFFPSLLCILIGGCFQKKYQIFVWGIMSYYTIVNMAMGDRGTWLYKIIVLIWLEMYYFKIKIDVKKILGSLIILIPLLYVIYSIVELRDVGTITWESILEKITTMDFPLFAPIREMGGSMNIICYLHTFGDSFWHYSNTYFIAFMGVLTSRFFGVLGLDLVLLDDFFSNYINVSYGVGFSMIGEAYLNFGYLSILLFFLFGFLFSMLFELRNNNSQEIQLFITTSSLACIIGWIRGSSYLYLKSLFYGTILIVILIKFVSKIKVK